MLGKHIITVSSQKVHFRLEIKRNITIIRGDSATGKTTLVGLISDYESLGRDSGVKLKCDKPCRVLFGNDWRLKLQYLRDSIVFIDEGNSFIRSEDFARAVRDSDNYYVIITRENLYNLPYSVEEIYEMKAIRKSISLGKVYNGIRRFYSDLPLSSHPLTDGELPITEDTNAGHDFYLHIANSEGVLCLAAGGKSKIFEMASRTQKKLVIIADGAAFGCEIDRLFNLQKTNPGRIKMYLPESFEWTVLASGLIADSQIRDILAAPENYVDSAKFFSWEQYFTELLEAKTRGSYLQYSKSKLAPYYLQSENLRKIIDFIEKE